MTNGWFLNTGVNIVIENIWDWIIFGGIWLNDEYPFELPRPNRYRKAVILDLGANVGYFSLLAANKCIKYEQPYHIYAFEGCHNTFDKLCERTKCLGDNITCTHGLVGLRKGKDYIAESANHVTSQIVHKDFNHPKILTNYVDIEQIIPAGRIDILKIDIEGSEFDFVDNYESVLKRTDLIYMEIHFDYGDPKVIRDKMRELGFKSHIVSQDINNTHCTEAFYHE